jgi:hypothetical protein
MAVHKSNVKKLRDLVAERQDVINDAIAILTKKIAKAEQAPTRSPLKKNLKANKESLADAQHVIKALNEAHTALRSGCCQNDLDCEIEDLP